MLWNTGYHKIICNKVKKLLIVIPIILISCANAYAKKYPFPEVSIEGVENPVSLAISHDGLRMVIIDWQKNGLPVLKESRRARIVNVWGPAFEINPINKLVNEGTRMEGPSFSFDGKFLLFAANFSDTHGGMDIYFSQFDGDTYTTPKNLGKPVNSGADENFASISGNNRELYFTREIEMKKLREYKTGELWTSAIKENILEWSEPQKVNSIINDGGIAYPKVYDDNQTLLYSRVVDDKENWKIYWTREFNQIHWYLPVKIDTLASTESEVSPVYCKQDGFLYFIQFSNKSNPPKGNIYKHQLDPAYHPKKTIEITGQIYDSVYNIPLKADVLVTNPVLGTTEFVTQSETESGNWSTLLLANENYMFQFWKKNYSHVYKNFLPVETQANSNLSVELTPHITLFLNTYDQEELWPLDVDVQIINDGERLADIRPEKSYKGRQQVILPIGKQYTLNFSKKDYFRNTLELNLSTFVLFDKFVRDIELKPVKRHLEIFVTEKDTLNPLEANIEFFDQRGNSAIPKKAYETPGLYEIILREGETFSVEVFLLSTW